MAQLNASMRQFLNGRRYAVLATLNEDESVHLTPVWYLFEREKFFIGSSSKSRKARNIRSRAKSSVVVDTRKPGSERWVSASGPAEIIAGSQSREINSRILQRYLTQATISDPRIGPGFAAADDITISLKPETWRSWAGADLDRQFFGGVLGATPEKWFLPLD